MMPEIPISKDRIAQAEAQIEKNQKEVDYDTKEYPIEVIVEKYMLHQETEENELFMPDYQRDFVWDRRRQSKFIESVLIGLPIPYLFVADVSDKEARLEIVDGSQRIRTLAEFVSDNLILENLEKLSMLNGFRFSDLPVTRQRRFLRRTIRMIELTEKADEEVRRDIFERINTGSDELKPMEIRRGIIEQNQFSQMLERIARDDLFERLAPLSPVKKRRREGEELVLRFFAYLDRYQTFEHSVQNFMDTYYREMSGNRDLDTQIMYDEFMQVLSFIDRHFPYGFRKNPASNVVPRVRFEAIAVGTALALRENPNLTPNSLDWLESDEFKRETTSDASNSRPRVASRIEFVKNNLLAQV